MWSTEHEAIRGGLCPMALPDLHVDISLTSVGERKLSIPFGEKSVFTEFLTATPGERNVEPENPGCLWT